MLQFLCARLFIQYIDIVIYFPVKPRGLRVGREVLRTFGWKAGRGLVALGLD